MLNESSHSDLSVLEVLPSGEGFWSIDSAIASCRVDWQALIDLGGGTGQSAEPIVIFDVQEWSSRPQELLNSSLRLGLRLRGDEDLEPLAHELALCSLIVIEFPHFTDGRGFSLAAQLRERYQYQGALRASGYLLVDQLSYLIRCGFNSVVFSNSIDKDEALSQLSGFSVTYQPST